MGSEWAKVKVDNITSANKGAIAIGPFGSRMKSDCYVAEGIPVIRGLNISSAKLFVGDFVYISAEKASTLGNANVYPGDIVFPHRGAIGKVAVVPNDDIGHYVLSSSLMKLTVNTDLAIPEFVVYFFRSSAGNHEILQYASTVGTPGIGQPLTSLRSMELPLPPLSEQKTIAHVLGALDDRIELNHQMNETLESMAQALFKSWFIDFDPVIDNALASGKEIPEAISERAQVRAALGDKRKPLPEEIRTLFPDEFTYSDELGWVPKGWEIGCLEDMVTLQRGFDLPKIKRTMGRFPLIAASGHDGTHNEAKVDGPGVVTGRSGRLGAVTFVQENFWPLNTTLWVKKYKNSTPYHAYQLLNTLELERYNSGSAVPTLNRNHVHGMRLIVPSMSTIKEFSCYSGEMFEKIHKNIEQYKSLSKLRDTLLPKLLSGEIRIPDTEKMVEELAL